MIVVDVVSLGDENSNVTTIGFVQLTLAVLLRYRGECCWLTFPCQRRAQQRRDTEGGRGLWVAACLS